MKDKIKIVVKKILFNNRSIINFLKKNVNFIYVRERDKYSFLRRIKYFIFFAFKKVVDIGYQGYGQKQGTIVPWAIGIDRNSTDYNGTNLPFPENSIDIIFACHIFEHNDNPGELLKEWFSKLKLNGKLHVIVPSLYWYERKKFPVSAFNDDHKYFYKPGSLLSLVENSLDNLNYKVESLRDKMKDINLETQEKFNMDKIYKSTKPLYEIEMVIEKISQPNFELTENTSSGMKYGFNNQDVGFSFCMGGFYQPEDWGVWSSSQISTLQILNRGNYKTIILDFNFPSKDININNIYINLKKHTFEILKEVNYIQIVFSEIIKENLTIEIKCDKNFKASKNNPDDKRILFFGLKTIEFN